ncbi:MAG: serine phosphatase RsbU (regulator of sigma subunit) [Arenicella sp.]|jgi:serine phosphatase RsbU (regulator of sigma subunit)
MNSLAQFKAENINLNDPSEKECYFLDSLLSTSNDFNKEGSKAYIECLSENLTEYDNYRLGLFYLDSLIQLSQSDENIGDLADCYYKKSMIHDHLGQYPEALSASQTALNIYKKIDNQSGVASSYNDIGVIHYYRGEDSLAKYYLNLSGEIFKELQDTGGLAIYYNNLGNVYFEAGDGEGALEMYKKGYGYDQYLNNPEGEAVSLCNIGETYAFLGDFSQAEESLLLALIIAEDLDDSWTLTVPLMSLGDLYKQTGEYHKAIHVLNRSLKLSQEIEALAEQAQTIKLLYEINKAQNNFPGALSFLEQLRTIEDSIFNEDSESLLKEMEMQYQVEDKQKEIELLNKESQIQTLTHEQEIEDGKGQQRILIISIVGIAIFLIVMIGGFVLKKKANNKLQEQNDVILNKNSELNIAYEQIEEKNNEILDSIRYAKRIQSAILPARDKITEFLPDSFVLYLPKDVVAGDFYWLEQVGNKTLFASADCTGHGVPGAMVSVVCNNGLNRSVREHGLNEPGKILDMTRKIILEEFGKSEEKVNDGMDIALCCLDGKTLTYAGAHNPLWIIKKGANEIFEIKADKQPVGKFDKAVPYTTHTVELETGDTIYLSTDGYADQFGGEKGKKLKTANFKKLLLSLTNRTMSEQHSRLNDAFEEWKDAIEQIDDVCVIGVRI